MMKTRGQRFVLTAMILLIGLTVFILHAKIGSTTSDDGSGEVRMAVDPMVLPPIQPPGTPETPVPADAETESPIQPEAADATTAPTPESVPQSAPEAVPAPAPEVAPAPTPAPTPAPKPKTAAPSKPKGDGSVTSIAVDSTDSEFTLTVTCDRPVGDTTYMNLKNPRRLVVDLREPWVLKTKNVIRPNNGAVKHVVVGSHPDRLRLVVHFNTAPKGQLTPHFVRSGNKLIVSVVLP